MVVEVEAECLFKKWAEVEKGAGVNPQAPLASDVDFPASLETLGKSR